MIEIKSEREINLMRNAGKIMKEIQKGKPAFPGHACISVNEQIIHGVPSKKVILKDGDIVTIDLVIEKDGYHVDMARTYEVRKKC